MGDVPIASVSASVDSGLWTYVCPVGTGYHSGLQWRRGRRPPLRPGRSLLLGAKRASVCKEKVGGKGTCHGRRRKQRWMLVRAGAAMIGATMVLALPAPSRAGRESSGQVDMEFVVNGQRRLGLG